MEKIKIYEPIFYLLIEFLDLSSTVHEKDIQ